MVVPGLACGETVRGKDGKRRKKGVEKGVPGSWVSPVLWRHYYPGKDKAGVVKVCM